MAQSGGLGLEAFRLRAEVVGRSEDPVHVDVVVGGDPGLQAPHLAHGEPELADRGLRVTRVAEREGEPRRDGKPRAACSGAGRGGRLADSCPPDANGLGSHPRNTVTKAGADAVTSAVGLVRQPSAGGRCLRSPPNLGRQRLPRNAPARAVPRLLIVPRRPLSRQRSRATGTAAEQRDCGRAIFAERMAATSPDLGSRESPGAS